MSKRLSIDTIRAAYFGDEADLLNGDVGFDDVRCDSCGAPVPAQSDELFRCCSKCGHEVEEPTESDE